MYTGQFAQYLKLERNYSARTVESYLSDLDLFGRYLETVEQGLVPSEADRDNVRMWLASMMEHGEKSTTVNRRLSTLRSYYRFLAGRGIISSSPVQGVKGPKNSKPLPHFVREDEMDSILDDADLGKGFTGVRNGCIMAVFYEAGLRLAELIGLDADDIDLQQRQLKVTGKRDKQRVIPFGRELESRLRAYLESRASLCVPLSPALFVNLRGERISRQEVYRMVRSTLARYSNVGKKSPHVLRHTFATSMLNEGAQLGAVKELLGHESLSTTQVYVHATFEQLKEIYRQAHPRGDK
ncbi:MAG: tyrosine-type recombinase/integrase [Bacteroidaceae bacterium]|nr:tyrosine-type recombinase/integrase [Bacteroidaceae bacterium]